MPTINSIQRKFAKLYAAMRDPEFQKTTKFNTHSESALLPLVRAFLLGAYGKVQPEFRVPLKKGSSHRIDFKIGRTAVEFAVRAKHKGAGSVAAGTNKTELMKLSKVHHHFTRDVPVAVLVLFDFSPTPLAKDRFRDAYGTLPSLGKGNHKRNAVTTLYFSASARRGFRRLARPT